MYILNFYGCFCFQFCVQLTLLGFAEFTLHLTRLGPEMLQVAQDCGRLTVTYFRFEVDDTKGKYRQTVILLVCIRSDRAVSQTDRQSIRSDRQTISQSTRQSITDVSRTDGQSVR